MNVRGARFGLALVASSLAGCTQEARLIAADQPQTAPTAPSDPRIPRYLGNYYQVSQGGRYFTWYGCGNCHGAGAKGAADLTNGRQQDVGRIYAAIAFDHPDAHPGYAQRIPTEQVWQMAAFVRDLAKHQPSFNRRNANDLQGEPQGVRWQGPLL